MITGMSNQNTIFAKWLSSEMDKRGWKPADLARQAGIARATLSNILNDMRGPGPSTCQKIAHAFGYPPEDVMRRAGLLPDKPVEDATMKEWMAAGRQLTDGERAELLEWAFAKLSRRQK